MERTKERTRIENEFEEMHIRLVWAELHARFGFNVAGWRKRYFEEWNKNRAQDEVGFFLVFMNKHVNPILNQLLCRNPIYPTFNKLTEYVVNKKR